MAQMKWMIGSRTAILGQDLHNFLFADDPPTTLFVG